MTATGRGRKMVAAALVVLALVALGLAARQWLSRPAPAVLLRRAIERIESKDSLGGARLLDELLARSPEHARALLYRGQAARDLGDPSAALGFWSRIPEDHPHEAGTARYLEGLLALSRHQAREAERLFVRSTQLHPTYLHPRNKLASLYQLQLRNAELKRELAAIRELRPWTLPELTASLGTMGKIYPITSRTNELEKFVAADERDIDSALALAECHLADDRADLAGLVLERGLATNPQDPRLRGRLAALRVAQHDLASAERLLGEERPDEPVEQCRARGLYFSAAEKWAQSAAAFEEALALDGEHQPTLYRYGLALERVGRHEEARQTLQEARLKEQIILQSWRIASMDAKETDFLCGVVLEIARLLDELDRHAEAVPWLEQALTWRPADTGLHARYERAIEQAHRELAAGSGVARARPGSHSAFDPSKEPRPGSPLKKGTVPPGRADSSGQSRSLERDSPLFQQAAATGGKSPGSPDRATEAPSAILPRLSLVDRHSEAGLEFQYKNGASGSKFLLETLGGGVAAFDYDGDGWPDLYFTQGRSLPVKQTGDPSEQDQEPTDRLFRNMRGTVRDVTGSAGLGDHQYSQGCAAGDFDNDGFPDLAVANFGTNVLYRNHGDGTFADVTVAAGISGEKWHSCLAFADLDRDGNLDLYVVTYVQEPYRICHPTPDRIATCSPLNFPAEQDQLYRSRGDGTFEDITSAAGIVAPDGKGLGIIVADFDNDGWPDIYVANDGTPNFLFQNDTREPGAPIRLQERGLVSGAAVSGAGNSQAGMGVACADLDGDGLLDLYVTNFYNESGTFYHNQGELLFADETARAGLWQPTRAFLGFGTQPIDVDLDGRPELFIANGHIDDFSFRGEPWKMRPQLFFNLGGARFAEVSQHAGSYFEGEYLGRGVARLDWNRDGKPDLAVVHQDRPAALLTNETPDVGKRVILDLHGTASNRDAIGARIVLTAGGIARMHEICGGDGFFATNERRVILGVGRVDDRGESGETRMDSLEIRWPSGRIDVWHDLPLESSIVVIESHPPRVSALRSAAP